MRVLHVDPFAGVAGDMLLGALLDLGADVEAVRGVLAGLGLGGWRLEVRADRQQGLAGTRVSVAVDVESHPARHLADVQRLLAGATLPARVRERSLAVFGAIFAAEARVHGTPVERTHLHEIAAVDALVDIVGTCAAVELLRVDEVSCGPVPVGRGTVATAHGLLPVPPPAVAALLEGVPLASHGADGEMTTPTGAALVRTLATRFGSLPGGRLAGSGVGLGTRTFAGVPNVLRVFLVDEAVPAPAWRGLAVVECTVDDLTGERVAHLIDHVRAAGALDAWALAGTGRKGRPVHELRVLADEEAAEAVADALFAEGATLGVRVVPCRRPELERRTLVVATEFGEVPVKVGVHRGVVVSAKPEFEVCRSLAERCGVPLARVEDAARAAGPRLGRTGDPTD